MPPLAILTPTSGSWHPDWEPYVALYGLGQGPWPGVLLVGPCVACGAALHAHDDTIVLSHPAPAHLLGKVLRLLEQILPPPQPR